MWSQQGLLYRLEVHLQPSWEMLARTPSSLFPGAPPQSSLTPGTVPALSALVPPGYPGSATFSNSCSPHLLSLRCPDSLVSSAHGPDCSAPSVLTQTASPSRWVFPGPFHTCQLYLPLHSDPQAFVHAKFPPWGCSLQDMARC